MATITLSEIEDKARKMIRAACPDDLMEVETLTTCRETGRVFVVLRCREQVASHDQPSPAAR